MSKIVLTNPYVTINGTDVTSYCNKAEFSVKVEDKDVTTYASNGYHEHLGGLKQGTLALEFLQDFGAGNLDATFWPLLGTVITFEIRPTNAARSASNPGYSGSVLMTDWNAITGKVGDVATVSVSWPTTAAFTRQTS